MPHGRSCHSSPGLSFFSAKSRRTISERNTSHCKAIHSFCSKPQSGAHLNAGSAQLTIPPSMWCRWCQAMWQSLTSSTFGDLNDQDLRGATLARVEALMPESRPRRHFKVPYSVHCRSSDSVISKPYQSFGSVFTVLARHSTRHQAPASPEARRRYIKLDVGTSCNSPD
jgi:hypothetical protein